MRASCPDEQELLALAVGDSGVAELRLHLQDCDKCGLRVHRLRSELAALRQAAEQPAEPFPQLLSASPLAMLRPFVPERIGRYTVVALLERGKCFDVYRVAHPAIGRELLLKLARRSAAGYRHAEPAMEEIRRLTAADHRNFARVYDAGFHEDRPFIVMARVKGQTLSQTLRTKRYSKFQAATLIARAARGAHALHRLGLVHRDINPHTIIIDERGEPHLTDCGLAAIAPTDARAESAYALGTARFTAPEQARGDHAAVGPATDVFALASLLRMLLFDCGVQPGIPRGLKRIIAKATQPQPTLRYRSGRELAEAIDRWRRTTICLRTAGILLLIVTTLALFSLMWVWMRDVIANST